MTNPVSPTPIAALPAAPQPSDTPAVFDSKAFALLTAQTAMVGQMNTAATQTYTNATAANERAVSAGSSATAAADSAAAANLDATRLAALDALWLGAFATDPATGRAGAPLVAGNAYVNTATGALRAYTGSAWVQGVHGAAGVASLNGMVGPLVLATLNAYGITDIGVGAKGATDLNTLVVPGMYTFAGAGNAPEGAASGTLFVVCSAGVLGQIVVSTSGAMFSRGATGIGGSPTFSPWRRGALHDDVVVPLAGGDIDCANGNYFTETVAANRTLAFTNVPAGAYACVVEVNHTAGTITLPAGTVFSNGSAPTFTPGKRHLLFFQRAKLGTAGWYFSTLANYAP